MKNKRKNLEEIIKDLSIEQKKEILKMDAPSRIRDQDNFKKNCKSIEDNFGFSWKKFDKVKVSLQLIEKESIKTKVRVKTVEELIEPLTPEQKDKILNMHRPSKVGDYKNYDRNTGFLNDCGISLLRFDEVKKHLEKNNSQDIK